MQITYITWFTQNGVTSIWISFANLVSALHAEFKKEKECLL